MIAAALLSLLIGVSLGLLGGGGSILTVPILVYVLGVPPKSAIATSLLVVGVTSAAATISHARAGHVRWKVAGLFGTAGMAGAYGGGHVARFVPAGVLLALFGTLMLLTAIALLRSRTPSVSADGEERGRHPLGRILLDGSIVGLVTGMVGAGGGFLVVPALVLLGGLPMRAAIGTSLAVIAMKSFAAFAGYAGHVPIDVPLAAIVTSAAVSGSLVGGLLSRRVPQARLRQGFAWFVVAMGIYVLGRELPASWKGVLMNVNASSTLLALAGGSLIGLAAAILLLVNGRVAGVSGITAGLLAPRRGDVLWRLLFVAGLVVGGGAVAVVRPDPFPYALDRSSAAVTAAGLLVGIGTTLANGCTSGHGVCGVSRLAPRSLAATATFMATGALVVFLLNRLFGGVL